MEPLVSILIPAKNEAQYIRECLISVQNQSYTNWEAIVVDDGSTDTTFDIVKEFSEQDKRINVFKNEGHGIIEALRMAFGKSKGVYITRMDADDRMMSDKIEVLLSGLIDKPGGWLSLGGVHYFSESGVGEGFRKYEEWLNSLTAKGTNFQDIFKECVIPSPCWMIKREDLVAVNSFDENRYPEDYDLALRFWEAGYKIVPTDKIIHEWRDYPSRTSRTAEHYKDPTFLPIKLHYFLKNKRDAERELILCGADVRGKKLAQELIMNQIDFKWVGGNTKKIGKHIYDIRILSLDKISSYSDKQIIITLANKTVKKELMEYFSEKGLKEMEDFFFFA